MKAFITGLLSATLLTAGMGAAFAASPSMAPSAMPRGTIAECSSPGDDSASWDTAANQLSEKLTQDGVKFTSIGDAVGCLQVGMTDPAGHQSFQYYDPESLTRVL